MSFDLFILLIFTLVFTGQRIATGKHFMWTRVREDDVRFWLFTRRNPEQYDVLVVDDIESIMNSHLNIYKGVKIIVHGWRNHGNSTLNRSLRSAYLTVNDYNVISVDWAQLSRKPYPVVRLMIDQLGYRIARMVDFLVTLGVPLRDIHLLGHSLGAHIAGVVGEKTIYGNISRISGLDPAGPLFYANQQGRLDPTDADFVDVIHTSGLCLGYYAPMGHVDFYPNRGIPIQPGCGLDVLGRCSHQRSYWLFAESILNAVPFVAAKCDSWGDYKVSLCSHEVLMGEYVHPWARGKYFLKTRNVSPFALGNSSFYALPTAVYEETTPTYDIEAITAHYNLNEDSCECANKNMAKVLKQMYDKVAWKRIRDKITDWAKTHDCYCLLHTKKPTAVNFIS